VEALQFIEGREALLGIVEGEKLAVYRAPISRAFLWSGLGVVLERYVG
jgi:hypothetical protein